jgi:hypothetical protein
MEKALGDGRGSHRRLRDKTSVDLETETRSNKEHTVVNTLSSILLSSPGGSSSSSVSSSVSTFANSGTGAEDRRERDRRWELDSRFVATDKLTSRLVLTLVYGCLRWENSPVNSPASRETGLEMPCCPPSDLLWVQITQSYPNRLRFSSLPCP